MTPAIWASIIMTIGMGLVGIICWFTAQTLKQVNENMRDLYDKSNNHETRIAHLEGEHQAIHGCTDNGSISKLHQSHQTM